MHRLLTPPDWFAYPNGPYRPLPITSKRSLDFHLTVPDHRVESIEVNFLDGHVGTFEGIYLWCFSSSHSLIPVRYYIGETYRLSISRLHQYVEEVFALNQNRIEPQPYARGRIPKVPSGNGGGWGFRYINHELEHNLFSAPAGMHGISLFVRSVAAGLSSQQDEDQTRAMGISKGAAIDHLWPTMETELKAASGKTKYLHKSWG